MRRTGASDRPLPSLHPEMIGRSPSRPGEDPRGTARSLPPPHRGVARGDRALCTGRRLGDGARGAGCRGADGDAVALFFSLAGFYGGTGKRVKFGVFKEAVGEVTSTAEERAALRAQAAADLVNLDAAERQRRNLVGNVGLGVTGVLALALWATGQPGLLRFAAVYPLFALAGAFRVSGEAGL